MIESALLDSSLSFRLSGGVYSEYLRAMRLKSEVEVEEGFVKADRSDLPAFYLGPTKIVAEECEYDL